MAKEKQEQLSKEDFDLTKAYELYCEYDIDEDTHKAEKKQLEAIAYALPFARTGNNEAKNFIVMIIQKEESNATPEVGKAAMDAFGKFFVNYVRTQCEADLKAKAIDNAAEASLYSNIEQAIDEAFATLSYDIMNYDPTKATLTTWAKPRIKDGITNMIAKSRGRKSKTTIQVDKNVSAVQKSLLEKGITPDARLIAIRSGYSIEQVNKSLSRMQSENQSVSMDAEEFTETNKMPQDFKTPEQQILLKEQAASLSNAWNLLTPLEQQVVSLRNGLDIDAKTGVIYNDNSARDVTNGSYGLSITAIAKELDISEFEVRRAELSGYRKMKNKIKDDGIDREGQKEDSLLKGRNVIFSKNRSDSDIAEIIDDIIEIVDTSYLPGNECLPEEESKF